MLKCKYVNKTHGKTMTSIKRAPGIIIIYFLIINNILFIYGSVTNNQVENEDFSKDDEVHRAVRRWAPLIFLAPGERFKPSSVPYFLEHTAPAFMDPNNKSVLSMTHQLPTGPDSEKYSLVTRQPIEKNLLNTSSFLYGQDLTKTSVPVYTVINRCKDKYSPANYRTFYSRSKPVATTRALENSFHVTYWLFYPFNEGKNVCTFTLGLLGPVPIPKVFNKCYGKQKFIGNHVGDWEHLSIYFRSAESPDRMYVSTHDAGVYYKYDAFAKVFVYERQETRTGNILQEPKFPRKVYLKHGRPVLYSAKGSHGLWSRPGKHQYIRFPKMYDETGNGAPWKTWENLEVFDAPRTKIPQWMAFRGRWGNYKTYCNRLDIVGINICQLSDGPTGIPMKRLNFICPS